MYDIAKNMIILARLSIKTMKRESNNYTMEIQTWIPSTVVDLLST